MWTDLLRTSALIASLLSLSAVDGTGAKNSYETELSSLLSTVVSDEGLVDYDALRGPLNNSFQAIVEIIETFDGPLDTDNRKKAFWMNAYNVHMLNNIVRNPEVQNIIEDGYAEEFFKTDRRAASISITLDEIEHTILRKQPAARYTDNAVSSIDPLIHVGLNCAAVSCPQLMRQAFTEDNIDDLLDRAMRRFAGSENHIRVEGNIIVLSSLLDWFSSDFEQTGMKVGDFILGYMSKDRPDREKLTSELHGKSIEDLRKRKNITFEYLWFVNDIKLQ